MLREVLGVVLVKILKKFNTANKSRCAKCIEIFSFKRVRKVACQAVA